MLPVRAATCALVLMLGLASCAGGSRPTGSGQSSASATHAVGARQLTVGEARGVFAAFLPRFKDMASQPSLARQIATDPESAALTLLGEGFGSLAGKLTGLRFLVPAMTSYPRWFAVAGVSNAGRGYLFLLVQQSAGGAWRYAAELYDLSVPPQIMSDLTFEGIRSSTVVSPTTSDDASLAVTPAALPADYAAYLDDGAKGPDGNVFAAGGYTNDDVTTYAQIAAAALPAGWRFSDTQSATSLPTYGIQLQNGAALIVFYTQDSESWIATSSSADVSRAYPAGLPHSPPGVMLADLGITKATAGLRLTATAIDENLAVVAPAGGGNVTVIVNDGKATRFSKN
jgi:hypothetical protein